jgi:hypothetical protein
MRYHTKASLPHPFDNTPQTKARLLTDRLFSRFRILAELRRPWGKTGDKSETDSPSFLDQRPRSAIALTTPTRANVVFRLTDLQAQPSDQLQPGI